MMMMIAAAAAVAAQPATPASRDAHSPHAMAQTGNVPNGDEAKKEKCCCDEMAKKHEGNVEHGGHTGR